jgi:hypothetical protein
MRSKFPTSLDSRELHAYLEVCPTFVFIVENNVQWCIKAEFMYHMIHMSYVVYDGMSGDSESFINEYMRHLFACKEMKTIRYGGNDGGERPEEREKERRKRTTRMRRKNEREKVEREDLGGIGGSVRRGRKEGKGDSLRLSRFQFLILYYIYSVPHCSWRNIRFSGYHTVRHGYYLGNCQQEVDKHRENSTLPQAPRCQGSLLVHCYHFIRELPGHVCPITWLSSSFSQLDI